jgi:small subunit ribosomal protein S21
MLRVLSDQEPSTGGRRAAAEGGEYPTVSEVKVREGETFESALRRFNKKIKQNGILSEVRRREHYEKPSVRRKRKLVAAKKRRLKAG